MEKQIKDILENALEEINEIINEVYDSEYAPMVIKHYGTQDQGAINEDYNNWTDSLCEDGVIPDFVYIEITHDDYSDSEWRDLANKALKL